MSEIKYLWHDCTVGIICPTCGAEVSIDSQAGKTACECGAVYWLEVSLKIGKIVIVEHDTRGEQ